ncbi:MAG: helix-turn-helix domain-containing protein [Myxococcota bacterium]
MRALAEQNYYELIEAPPDGTPQQIERAYRIARSAYLPSSAATYSLYSSEDCAAILRRIEEAWAVLSDTRLRREYDARLGRTEPVTLVSVGAERAGRLEAPKPLEPVRERRGAPPTALPASRRPAPELDVENGFAPESGVFDGEVLRRIRVSLGIELEEISSITKINEQHLRSIEGNQYDVLPAPVYLRGFLKQIAKCLSLDPAQVADSYTNRMRESASRRP